MAVTRAQGVRSFKAVGITWLRMEFRATVARMEHRPHARQGEAVPRLAESVQ